jgi:hypothetical protein
MECLNEKKVIFIVLLHNYKILTQQIYYIVGKRTRCSKKKSNTLVQTKAKPLIANHNARPGETQLSYLKSNW